MQRTKRDAPDTPPATAAAEKSIKLQVTTDLNVALAQLGDDAHKPLSLNPHADFIMLDTDKKILRRLHLYLGTNCGLYWAGGVFKRNKDAPKGPEDDGFEWDANDIKTLRHNVKYFLQEGYACVLTYNSEGLYQYPRHYSLKKAPKVKILTPFKEWEELDDYEIELEFIDRLFKKRNSSVTVYSIGLPQLVTKKPKNEKLE